MVSNEKYELLKQTRFSILGNLGALLIVSMDDKVQLHNEAYYMALKSNDEVLVEIVDNLVHDYTWSIDFTPSLRQGVKNLIDALQVVCSNLDNTLDEMNSEVITEHINDMFNE